MQMGGQSTSASSSSSSSSSESSRGHREREEKGMDKDQYAGLNYTSAPAPGFVHSRGKKHHRHRYHICASPPSPSHHHRHFFEHPLMEGPHHYSFPPPMGSPQHQQFMKHSPEEGPLPPPKGFPDQHHHYKEGKLRVKPPKHLKKVHKLHRKLMKAYKLPKSTRDGAHHLHRMQFPPPEKGFFSAPFGYNYHPPGCCRHIMEAMEGPSRLHEMGILHERPRCHGMHPHPVCPRGLLIKSEVAGGDVAIVSPKGMKASADLPIEGPMMALISDMPPVDEPEPVVLAF